MAYILNMSRMMEQPGGSIPSVSSVTSCDVLMPDSFVSNKTKERKRSGPSTSSETSILSSEYKTLNFQRMLCIFAISSLTLCLVLIGLVVYLFVQLNSIQDNLNNEIWVREQSYGQVCLPCEEIELGPFANDNPDLDSIEQRLDDKGTLTCCANSPNQTKILLDLFWQRKKLQQEAAENIKAEEKKGSSTVKPALLLNIDSAHLLVGLQNSTTRRATGPSTPIRNWNMNDPIAHISGKLSLHNDRLRVATSGLYFLYSQVYFEAVYGNGYSGTDRNVYHYVYRFNHIYPNGGRQLLMKNVVTQCWEQQKSYWDYTSYTGAAIHLNAGDEIYVNVTNISLVSRDSKASFLGMFKIS